MYVIMPDPFFGIFRKKENEWQMWNNCNWFKTDKETWVPMLDNGWDEILNKLPVVSVCEAFQILKKRTAQNDEGYVVYYLREFSKSIAEE